MKPVKRWTWEAICKAEFVAEGLEHSWTAKELQLLKTTLAEIKKDRTIVTTQDADHWIASHTKFNAKIPKKVIQQKIMDILIRGKDQAEK